MTARDESGCPWSWSRISLLNGAPAFSSPNPRRTATLSVEVERSCDAGEGERGPVVRVGERSRLRAGPAVPHGLECDPIHPSRLLIPALVSIGKAHVPGRRRPQPILRPMQGPGRIEAVAQMLNV